VKVPRLLLEKTVPGKPYHAAAYYYYYYYYYYYCVDRVAGKKMSS